MKLLGIDLPIPDPATRSRRGRAFGHVQLAARRGSGPLHIAIDSTGLRVHSGQRWAPPKQRAWRKLQLAVDRDSGEILAVALSRRKTHDSTRVPKLLKQTSGRLRSACADGSCDTAAVDEAPHERGWRRRPRVWIPPARNARARPDPPPELKERNRNVRDVNRLGRRARYRWSGAYARARVENAFFRCKAILGREMRARTLAGQRAAARIGAKILNRMAQLGMPESYCAA